MAEDLDVEAMLEAPYRKDDESISVSKRDRDRENGSSRHKSSSKSRPRSRSRDRKEKDRSGRDKDRDRDRDRGRDRDNDRERERDRDRDRRPKSNDKNERHRSKDKEQRRRSRSRDRKEKREKRSPKEVHPGRERRRSPSPGPYNRRGRTPPNGLGYKAPLEDLSPEERDARTVFCMQLSQRIRARDLEEFFSSVGKVRDVRLITCNKTRRFKGIAYIEFKDPESVPLALGLTGQKLLGIPIVVQHTQAEKNRMGNSMPNLMPKVHTGPMRLYIGSLHFNITEDMLRGIFEPFGKIDSIELIKDPETDKSKGYGFLTFHNHDDAKKALEQLNGFELAGRPMKVGNVTERLDFQTSASMLDTDELDRSGIDLGATGRLQLMFKLAEGAGLAVPQAAATALLASAPQPQAPIQANPPIATQSFMLANMFDPSSETNPSWDIEIRDDVVEECNKHGGVLHVYVDKSSNQGNVYVKCPSIAAAVAAVNSLHGRWFAGRVITAAYVPLVNYHSLFPDAMSSLQLLVPSAARRGGM